MVRCAAVDDGEGVCNTSTARPSCVSQAGGVNEAHMNDKDSSHSGVDASGHEHIWGLHTLLLFDIPHKDQLTAI